MQLQGYDLSGITAYTAGVLHWIDTGSLGRTGWERDAVGGVGHVALFVRKQQDAALGCHDNLEVMISGQSNMAAIILGMFTDPGPLGEL